MVLRSSRSVTPRLSRIPTTITGRPIAIRWISLQFKTNDAASNSTSTHVSDSSLPLLEKSSSTSTSTCTFSSASSPLIPLFSPIVGISSSCSSSSYSERKPPRFSSSFKFSTTRPTSRPPSFQSSSSSSSSLSSHLPPIISKSLSSTPNHSQIPNPANPNPIYPPHPNLDYPSNLPPSFGSNQSVSVPPEVLKELKNVVEAFKAPVRYCFAYGSGVFRQVGYKEDKDNKPLLDFIFVVTHPSHWHSINMHQNPSHYPLLIRLLGSQVVSWLQENVGARVWFNLRVDVEGKLIKYGVVSLDALRNDLLDWETLYIAGRMHKPIKILKDDPRLRLDNQVNLTGALRTALLLLPERFTELELYETLAGLSYRGDFRMKLAENPQKVSNIVSPQLDRFRKIYGGFFLSGSFKKLVGVVGVDIPNSNSNSNSSSSSSSSSSSLESTSSTSSTSPLLSITSSSSPSESGSPSLKSTSPLVSTSPSQGIGIGIGSPSRQLKQDITPKARSELARRLPFGLREEVLKRYGIGGGGGGKEEELLVWQRIVGDEGFRNVLDESIQSIVQKSTYSQAFKGILSAGFLASFKYSIEKLKKRWKGKKGVEKKRKDE